MTLPKSVLIPLTRWLVCLSVVALGGCASTGDEQDAPPRKLTDCFGISIGTGIRIGYGSLGITLGQERCRERQRQEQEAGDAGRAEAAEPAPAAVPAGEENPTATEQ